MARHPTRRGPWCSRQRVEASAGHGIEGSGPTSPESGDRPAGPALQGTHERRPVLQIAAGPGHFEGQQGSQAG